MKQPRILTAEQAYLRATADCARAERCRHDLMQRMLRGGLSREEIEDVLDRLGAEALEQALWSDDLLRRKDEILAAPLKTR